MIPRCFQFGFKEYKYLLRRISFLSLFVASIGLGLIILSTFGAVHSLHFRRISTPTTGKVSRVDLRPAIGCKGGGIVALKMCPTIKYFVDKQEYKIAGYCRCSDYVYVGQKLDVFYDPEHPHMAKEIKYTFLFTMFLGGIISLFGIGGFRYHLRHLGKKTVRRS